MSKAKLTRTKTSASKAASSTNSIVKVLKKKEERQKAKSVGWASRISQLAVDRKYEQQSKNAPLKHFELLQQSIHHIDKEMNTKKEPTKADLNRHKVTSARGRAQALLKERKRFSLVVKHPGFCKNPIGTIHAHLSSSIHHTPRQ